jgi:hypothetical protein
MKPIERRKAVQEIRQLCRERGISFEEISSRGNGSHGSWIFSDQEGGKAVRVVIVYDKEISPIVQRSIVQRLQDRLVGLAIREGAHELIHVVYDILNAIFGA